MTHAKLILENSTGTVGSTSQVFNLADNRITLGRSPDCTIRFDSQAYGGVSRHHATVHKVSTRPDGSSIWQLCDESSANGTFINGQQLQGCVTLTPGDQIMLSQNGPVLTYSLETSPSYSPVAPPIAPIPQPLPNRPLPPTPAEVNTNPSFSQLIPVVSSSRNFRSFLSKGYVLPGIILIIWVVGLFFSGGNLGFFIDSLGVFLGAIAYSFIYSLCGKRKPWWEIAAAIILTMLLLLIPWFINPFLFFFRGVLPGNINGAGNNFVNLFIAHFFGAGLSEELLKIIPVFILMYLSKYLGKATDGNQKSLGVKEPLDGIVLASASGLGFTLVETLTQYVPNLINSVAIELGGSADAIQTGQLLGIQLLVPRIIGSLAGHMAYSGYFGYFVGLSVLFPQRRLLTLTIGYYTSSLLHALWNASGSTLGPIMLAVAGILSYVFLIAAILKARELSPTRSQNFATRLAPPDTWKR